MKLSRGPSGRMAAQKCGVVALACLLLPCIVLSMINYSNFDTFSLWNLQLSIRSSVQLARIQADEADGRDSSQPAGMGNTNPLTDHGKEIQTDDMNNATIAVNTDAEGLQLLHVPQENIVIEKKLWCDFSQLRSDTCFMHGDVRFHGPSSSLILHSPSHSDDASSQQNSTWKIRPYARKWETMDTISEITLRFSTKGDEISPCNVIHNVPAIVFSTGGFLGNFFHDFNDVLVPLFISSRQYHGEVQFLVTNFNSWWLNKYKSILNQLTKYEIINMEQDGRIHCFPQAQVGLMSHKELGVDPSKAPNGYSMSDFKDMLMTTLSLKRKSVMNGIKRPRLLILQRKGSRSWMNEREVVGLGRSLGFKVVVAGPEEARNLSRFARVVNSCDAMMGVHGAGLTNMLFLPAGAAVIQVIPWGGLKYGCRYLFGEPAPDIGVRYFDYEIKEEESSLIQQYPRDHPIFTDPLSIHKQGWNALYSFFLQKQSVKLDVGRFKPTLLQVLQALS